jgi:hypothetical protein
MELGHLPELRAKFEKFAEAARELDYAIQVYRMHSICPLDEATVQNITLARHTADNVMRNMEEGK